MRLEISRRARVDLEDISEFGEARFGRPRARTYLDAFGSVFALIRDHPQAGAAYDHADAQIRSIACQSHRVYYEVSSDRIVIQRVLHKAMDPERHL